MQLTHALLRMSDAVLLLLGPGSAEEGGGDDVTVRCTSPDAPKPTQARADRPPRWPQKITPDSAPFTRKEG